MAENTIKLSLVQKRQRTERFLGIVAVGTMIAAWMIGAMRAEADLMPAIEEAIPTADHFEELDNDLYRAWRDSGEEEILGYVALGEAGGYGGPMIMAVGVSPQGEIIGAAVATHKETPAWMDRIRDNDFVKLLIGKQYSDRFVMKSDVDGVTGATYTSRAIAEAVREGSHAVAIQVGLPVADQPEPRIIFGTQEIILLGLFVVGHFGHQPKFKYKKQVRWASMIIGMVFLGFVYNSPLTIAYINKFLLGFWPQWQTNLYWYFLIGGILFVFAVDNKNPYCEWFCPFGAAQECMGAIGGAEVRTPRQYRELFAWTQRGLAWLAIVVALIFRSPGLSSYEIFGTMFDFLGSSVQFLLLGIILIAALFMRRPWCNYLCPLRPVTDMIRLVRRWVLEKWQNLKPKTAV